MRTLKRNKVEVTYALYDGKAEIQNSDGTYTGEWEKTYSEPVTLMANVAPATGNASVEPFGVDTNYSHIMVVEGTDCPIAEETIVLYNGQTYRVVRVAKSLNHIRYALREVQTDEGEYIPSDTEDEGNG
jgi:hypothetical protein